MVFAGGALASVVLVRVKRIPVEGTRTHFFSYAPHLRHQICGLTGVRRPRERRQPGDGVHHGGGSAPQLVRGWNLGPRVGNFSKLTIYERPLLCGASFCAYKMSTIRRCLLCSAGLTSGARITFDRPIRDQNFGYYIKNVRHNFTLGGQD